MFYKLGIIVVGAGTGDWGPFNFIKGLFDILWLILQLLWMVIQLIFGFGALSEVQILNAAHEITSKTVAWVSDLLLLSPFNPYMLDGGASLEQENATSSSVMTGLTVAFKTVGMENLPTLCIEAGLALTMIAFFYGFAESSVQLEKTNLQLIFSRILRWIISVGIVTVSYLAFSYLFQAFRSLYSLGTFSKGGASVWYNEVLDAMKPAKQGWNSTTRLVDVESLFDATPDSSPFEYITNDNFFDNFSGMENSPLGVIVLFFGLVKLIKKAIKFVVEQIPAFAKVVFFFVCAPLGMAMFAAPETQQKANQYLKQFAGATLTNLFKVAAIAFSTYLAMHITFPVDVGSIKGNVSILNVMPVVAQLLNLGFKTQAWGELDEPIRILIVRTLAFLMTSGGFLGYQLYFDLISKASDMGERLAHEIMT